MKFRAASYSMGKEITGVTFEANSYAEARRHRRVRALPAGANGDRGKIQVIGIKLLR